jgi:hypothetical protein
LQISEQVDPLLDSSINALTSAVYYPLASNGELTSVNPGGRSRLWPLGARADYAGLLKQSYAQ